MTQAQNADLIPQLLRSVASELGLQLTELQIAQLTSHFSLLLKWNRKINLTGLRRVEEIAWRHFGESLYLAKIWRPSSESPEAEMMVDVGSGAGFPGLPLKVYWPQLAAVLLEPNHKKMAFLKEVVRTCGLPDVEVRTERLEHAIMGKLRARASLVTMRAVGVSEEMLAHLGKLLRPGGHLALFLGADDATRVATMGGFDWDPAVAIPHSERRVILLGQVQPR